MKRFWKHLRQDFKLSDILWALAGSEVCWAVIGNWIWGLSFFIGAISVHVAMAYAGMKIAEEDGEQD